MQKGPRVVFLTIEDATYQVMVDQVKEYLGDLVVTEGYSMQSGLPRRIDGALVVAATQAVLEYASPLIPPHVRKVVARRGVSGTRLNEVLALPNRTKVLVVSRDLQGVEEVAEILTSLGIDHVHYIPWVPGLPVPEVDTAITPGGAHLVPSQVSTIVDLGIRPLNISTLVDIIQACDLDTDLVNSVSFRYVRDMVRLNQRLSSTVFELEQRKVQLETLIGFLDEGVVYVDRAGSVRVCNHAAQEMLGASDLLGRQLSEVMETNLVNAGLDSGLSDHSVIDCASKRVSVTVVPVKIDEEVAGAICVLREVAALTRLEQQIVQGLRSGHTADYTIEDMHGTSQPMKRLRDSLHRIARNDLTVLVTGESGVGKEVAAQAIHNLSDRRNGPFVAVNFAALPESLAESELFGYEEGAFTGARRGGRRGYFEEAHRGTIFLDEIGDAPPSVQASLLRVLQEKRIARVGGLKMVPVDFRVIAATNRSLKELVVEGGFRRDLYYRLNVLNLKIPPLRDRREDIPELARRFLQRSGRRLHLPEDVMTVLWDHDWPGNVRELQNVISHLLCVCDGPSASLEDLPAALFEDSADPVLDDLYSFGDVRLIQEILHCLQVHSSAVGVGRDLINREIPTHPGVNLVRRYLDYLADIGACSVGSTRRGTRITAKGVRLLADIRWHLDRSASKIPPKDSLR